MPEDGAAGAAAGAAATGETANAAPPAGANAETSATTSSADDAFWERLSAADPDELVKRHPRLAGRIGTLSQKQAERLTAQQMEQYRTEQAKLAAADLYRREQEERVRLAREDPDQLAERVLAEVAEQGRESERAQHWAQYQQVTNQRLQAQIDAIYESPEIKALWESGSDEIRKQLDYRNYPDFTQFSIGVAKAYAADQVGKRGEEVAKARLEAIQADTKTAQFRRDGAAAADLNLTGGPNPGHVYTREEIARMDTATYRKHKAAIYQQEADGLIQ